MIRRMLVVFLFAAVLAPSGSTNTNCEIGIATWYGVPYHGRRTASGEIYNMHALTAAHRTLAFGTRVTVCNLANGRCVQVRINDRGPFGRRRIIDVSWSAAKQLGMAKAGVARVEIQVIEKESE